VQNEVGKFSKWLMLDRMGWSEGAVRYVSLQVHYDNPQRIAGLRDNSGVRIYYTTQLRQNDAGVLQLGDPAVSAPSIAPGIKAKHYEFNCPRYGHNS
jgi:hypothetical protein